MNLFSKKISGIPNEDTSSGLSLKGPLSAVILAGLLTTGASANPIAEIFKFAADLFKHEITKTEQHAKIKTHDNNLTKKLDGNVLKVKSPKLK